MVTPSTSNNSSPASNTRSKKKGGEKRGGWTRNPSTTTTDVKVQKSSNIGNLQSEERTSTPLAPPKYIDPKKLSDSKEEKKNQVGSAGSHGEPKKNDQKTESTSSNKLTDRIEEFIKRRLSKDLEGKADQMVNLPDDKFDSSITALLDSKSKGKEQAPSPSIDPKLFEETQKEKEKLEGEVKKLSHTVKSQEEALQEKDKKIEELFHKEIQTNLHLVTLSQEFKKVYPNDDSFVGDKYTKEYMKEALDNAEKEVNSLKSLHGLSIEHNSHKSSETNQKSKNEKGVTRHILAHEKVEKLFDEVSILHSKTGVEVGKLNTKDKRSPEEIYESFMSMLENAKKHASFCYDLKSNLTKDIEQIQKKITDSKVPLFTEEQVAAIPILSKFYTKERFAKDIEQHIIEHNKMQADLSDVIIRYEETVKMLREITHNIGIALMDFNNDEKFHDTKMEVLSLLHKLPLSMESILISEVKESVIKGAFRYIYQAIRTFRDQARDNRKLLTKRETTREEIKHIATIQKINLTELELAWYQIAPHVNKLIEELKEKVATGNQNEKLSYTTLQTIANLQLTTPRIYERDVIEPYNKDLKERNETLHQLQNEMKKLDEEADLAKKEVHRTCSAALTGRYTSETMYDWTGVEDEEVKSLFTRPIQEIRKTIEEDSKPKKEDTKPKEEDSKQDNGGSSWANYFSS